MLRVLIVDDVEEIGHALGRVLRHRGYEALFAASGDEAFNLLRREHVDVAIVDLGLPDDGLALLDRARSETPSVALIAMSGSPENLKEALDLGYEHQLVKPFPFDAMLAMLECVVDLRAVALEE